jgi:hypothetical protein
MPGLDVSLCDLGGLQMSVERSNGQISSEQLGGNTVITITLEGLHSPDDDMLDRTLQFIMLELGILPTPAAPPDPEPLATIDIPPPVEDYVPIPPTFVEP